MSSASISSRSSATASTATRWRLGTMGLAYKEWLGNVYPPSLPASQWLRCYATQFNAIEMNTTFYATPDEDRLRAWSDATPPDFRFSLKVGKHITHETPLVEAPPLMRSFLDAVRPLEEKLGPLLIQLSPRHRSRELGAIRYLLKTLPRDLRFALELRHYSWRHDRVFPELCALLREYNVALVGLDHEDFPEQAALARTADFDYLRLVGRHGRFATQSHELFDPTAELQRWHQRLVAQPTDEPRETWVLFNNDYAGHGPTTLRRFASLVGMPLPPPPQQQRRLFD